MNPSISHKFKNIIISQYIKLIFYIKFDESELIILLIFIFNIILNIIGCIIYIIDFFNYIINKKERMIYKNLKK